MLSYYIFINKSIETYRNLVTMAGYTNEGYNGVGGPRHSPGAGKAHDDFGDLCFYIRLIYTCYDIHTIEN